MYGFRIIGFFYGVQTYRKFAHIAPYLPLFPGTGEGTLPGARRGAERLKSYLWSVEREAFTARINELAGREEPFLFLVDFEGRKPQVYTPVEASEAGLFFHIRGHTNRTTVTARTRNVELRSKPVSFERYEQAFRLVRSHILHGDSYLANLTFPTQIELNIGMEEVFDHGNAPYRILKKDEFTCFSPECFIRTGNGKVYSYPMKGTMDASVPDARGKLMKSDKERWEHHTIVDLIRNDLSMISRDVEVTRFRYIERVEGHRQSLLQVSSEIRGNLDPGWKKQLGTLLFSILPAGSISGAPKKKTVEIIRKAEQAERGYFTGIFGYFDGENLDSGVMIRYMEKTPDGMQFRSGGGITGHSDAATEYDELIQKVYEPIV